MSQSNSVIDTLNYVRRFSGQTILVKIGGALLKTPDQIKALCEDFALIRSLGIKIIVVHGGGPLINEELERHGVESKFVKGQRVTTPEMVKVVEMVLSGSINRQVVRTLNSAGVSAVGMSGIDANTFLCRPTEGMGQVGQIDRVETEYIQNILDSKSSPVPVIAPIGTDHDGKAYNINADWAATKLAGALKIKKVFFMTDQDGILDQQGKLISELDTLSLQKLIHDDIVQGGMLAKAQTILKALKQDVSAIHIINGLRPNSLIEELFTASGIGTVCRYRFQPGNVYQSWGSENARS